MTKILHAFDLRLVEAARSLLARIRTSFGADKYSLIRDIHLVQSGVGAAWAWFGVGLSWFVAVFGVALVGINVLLANRAAGRIGSAETVRGYETAMREASASYLGNRGRRLFNLFLDATFFLFMAVTAWAALRGAGPDWNPDPLVALILMTVYSSLGSVLAYVEAAPPPAPGSRRTSEAPSALPEGNAP